MVIVVFANCGLLFFVSPSLSLFWLFSIRYLVLGFVFCPALPTVPHSGRKQNNVLLVFALALPRFSNQFCNCFFCFTVIPFVVVTVVSVVAVVVAVALCVAAHACLTFGCQTQAPSWSCPIPVAGCGRFCLCGPVNLAYISNCFIFGASLTAHFAFFPNDLICIYQFFFRKNLSKNVARKTTSAVSIKSSFD